MTDVLRDAIDDDVARLTGGAKATLASLQALAARQVKPEPDDPPPPSAEDGKPAPTF